MSVEDFSPLLHQVAGCHSGIPSSKQNCDILFVQSRRRENDKSN